MSKPVISVENLGKVYRIGHQTGGPRYTALRDVISDSFRRLIRRQPQGNSLSQEDFWALQDVSFEVKQGEVMGIIGRNGAGKSTLLKILSRITEPTKGRVRVRGRVASLLEVGTGFHPELTGRENIFLNGAILGMTRVEIRRKFDEIVAFAEIEKFIDTPVKRYSSGMYVRLAFAVAAHLEPEILIVDEVLAVGDSEFQKKCMGKMQEVHQTARTILFVSHNTGAIQTLCTRAVLLKHGRIEQTGEVGRVVDHYLYAGESEKNASSSWIRPGKESSSGRAFFTEITARLEGEQPYMQLSCELKIKCIDKNCPKTFVSLDICDIAGTPFLNPVPVPHPFIEMTEGDYLLNFQVDLPPLIPGRYLVSVWIGPDYTSQIDYVTHAVEFTIEDTPTVGRTYPHFRDLGYVVPVSRCTYFKVS
jgi:lipopolysaccharide transport system ATP-binding protein